VQQLAEQEDRDALPKIIGLVRQERDGTFRDEVIAALGHYRTAAASILPLLTRIVREHKKWEPGPEMWFAGVEPPSRAAWDGPGPAALRALGRLEERALPSYLELLDCPNRTAREEAVLGIMGLKEKGRSAGPSLARRLLQDKDEDVRTWATLAMVEIRSTDKAVLQALRRCCSDRTLLVRVYAADALMKLGHNKGSAVLVLTDVLRRAQERRLWCETADSLAAYGSAARPAMPLLKEALWDSETSANALHALIAIDPDGGPSLMPALGRGLQEGNDDLVRVIARNVHYVRLPPKALQSALLGALRRPVSPGTRLALLDALANSGGASPLRGALPVLRELLKDHDEEVRAKARHLLKRWSAKERKDAKPSPK
jgi:HEAT repeat protein